MGFAFWQRWLFILAIVIIVFGLLLAFLSQTAVFELLFNRQINPVFWGTSEVEPNVRRFQSWIYGVLGATVAGWGVFLAYIARYPFKERESWAWNCIALGMLGWYLVDTALSISFRVYYNAVFNTILLAGIVLPLVMTRREFERR